MLPSETFGKGGGPRGVYIGRYYSHVFGDTVGPVAGGVTVAGRTMALGSGFPARFVGFAAESGSESFSDQPRGREPKCLLLML